MLLTELPQFTIEMLTFKSDHTWCNTDLTMTLESYDAIVIPTTTFSTDGVSNHTISVDIEELREVVTQNFTYQIVMGDTRLEYTAEIIMYECLYNTVWG